jgi:hypothetical protein
VMPWWFQQKMSAAAEARLFDLGGDHSPFLSVPDELVARLLDIGTNGPAVGGQDIRRRLRDDERGAVMRHGSPDS